MPVSETLRRLCEDNAFWAAYLCREDPADGPGGAEIRVDLPVAAGYGLVLDLDPAGGQHTLGLRQPAASDPVHLGGSGPGRPPTAVLRWPELDVIGRVLALDDPTLPHPGLPVALLVPFTGGDLAMAGTMLPAALRSLRRPVTPVPPVLPEQAPLPLFTAARWWPQPEQPSDRVLSDPDVAGHLSSHLGADTVAAADHRGRRFPADGLAELVRQARARLDRLRRADWYAAAGALPLARRMCLAGELTGLPQLAAALTRAGCDHPTVLDALTGPVEPAEAGWMVETLAGVAPGTLLDRLSPAGSRRPGADHRGY